MNAAGGSIRFLSLSENSIECIQSNYAELRLADNSQSNYAERAASINLQYIPNRVN